jgi:hypothetical protein
VERAIERSARSRRGVKVVAYAVGVTLGETARHKRWHDLPPQGNAPKRRQVSIRVL